MSASVHVAESSRNIRLRTDLNTNIVQENAAEDKKEELPTTVTKGLMLLNPQKNLLDQMT